jgi:hypothetical protein
VSKLSRTFDYIFAEDDWFNTVLIGGVYIALSPLLIGLVMVMGFQVELTKRILRGEQGMPLWRNASVLFRSGVRSFLISLGYVAVIIAVLVLLQIPVLSLTTAGILLAVHFFLNPLLIRRFAATGSLRSCLNPFGIVMSVKGTFRTYVRGIGVTSCMIIAAILFGWMWIVVGWPILVFLMMAVQTVYFAEQ